VYLVAREFSPAAGWRRDWSTVDPVANGHRRRSPGYRLAARKWPAVSRKGLRVDGVLGLDLVGVDELPVPPDDHHVAASHGLMDEAGQLLRCGVGVGAGDGPANLVVVQVHRLARTWLPGSASRAVV
jgi:hypothetical protein